MGISVPRRRQEAISRLGLAAGGDVGRYIRLIKKAVPQESWKAYFHDDAARAFAMDVRE